MLVTKTGKGGHRTGKGKRLFTRTGTATSTGTDSLTSIIQYMCYYYLDCSLVTLTL